MNRDSLVVERSYVKQEVRGSMPGSGLYLSFILLLLKTLLMALMISLSYLVHELAKDLHMLTILITPLLFIVSINAICNIFPMFFLYNMIC